MDRSHPIHELIVRESVVDGLRYLGEDFRDLISKQNITEDTKQEIADKIYPYVWITCEHFGIIDPENFEIEEPALDLAISEVFDMEVSFIPLEEGIKMGMAKYYQSRAPGRIKRGVKYKQYASASGQKSLGHLKNVGTEMKAAAKYAANKNFLKAGRTAVGAVGSAAMSAGRAALGAGQKVASMYNTYTGNRFKSAVARRQAKETRTQNIKSELEKQRQANMGGT